MGVLIKGVIKSTLTIRWEKESLQCTPQTRTLVSGSPGRNEGTSETGSETELTRIEDE